jgi:XTP/dITP diphosphohydrolase
MWRFFGRYLSRSKNPSDTRQVVSDTISTPLALRVATTNRGKLGELERLLAPGIELRLQSPEFEAPEEAGATYLANALAKARALAAATAEIALGEDSGLEVDALGGGPGMRSARYAPTDAERVGRLLRELEGVPADRRTARFRCAIAVVWPDGREAIAEGRVEGVIVAGPRGGGGFGYDPIFAPAGSGRTFAELSEREKDAVSHRGDAARALRRKLDSNGR